MNLQDCNPFVRAAEIQPAVLEGAGLRQAYDHRIFYILEGEGRLIMEEASYEIRPDTILYFRPGVGYHFKGRMRVAVLNFDLTRRCAHRTTPICPPPAAEFDPALRFDDTVFPEPAQPVIRGGCRHLQEDLLRLTDAFREGDPLADAVTSGLLKKLLADFFGGPRQEADPGQALIRRVERYIRLYAAEIQSNEQIGKFFGYHPVYIATLFKEKTGNSLHRAILHRRIELACQWLTRTDHPVESIAFDTGFTSRSHFCTVFKEQMGCSPGQYRNRMK